MVTIKMANEKLIDEVVEMIRFDMAQRGYYSHIDREPYLREIRIEPLILSGSGPRTSECDYITIKIPAVVRNPAW